MSNSTQQLASIIGQFRAYETHLGIKEYEEAFEVVRELQTALDQIPLPEPYFGLAALQKTYPERHPEPWYNPQAAMEQQDALREARNQVDQVRMYMAAFEPYAQSRELKYLQARRELVSELKTLAEVVRKIDGLNRRELQVVSQTEGAKRCP